MTIISTQRASVNGTQLKETSFAAQSQALENILVLCGQYDQSKTLVVENQLYLLQTPKATGNTFGFNSQLYLLHLAAYLQHGGNVTTYGIAIAEPTDATAATGEFDFTGTVITEDGDYVFYPGGVEDVLDNGYRMSISCVTTDTPTTLGAKLATAINASKNVPISAVNTAGVVATTGKWKGTSGNLIRMSGPWDVNDPAAPAGLSVSITQMSGGTVSEDTVIGAAWAAIAADTKWKTQVVTPCTTSASIATANAVIGLPDDGTGKGSGLWSDPVMRPCVNFVGSYETTYATVAAIGESYKNSASTVIACAPDRLEMPPVIAAKMAAYVASSANSNAAHAYKENPIQLGRPVSKANDWTITNADAAFKSGLAIVKIDSAGNSEIGDVNTTWHPDGSVTPAFRELVNVIKSWNISSDVKNDKLANKKDVIVQNAANAVDQPMATDDFLEKSRIVALVPQWEQRGLVYNGDFTINNLVVRLNSENPDRFDRKIPVLLSGNKRVMSDTILLDRNLTIANSIVVL